MNQSTPSALTPADSGQPTLGCQPWAGSAACLPIGRAGGSLPWAAVPLANGTPLLHLGFPQILLETMLGTGSGFSLPLCRAPARILVAVARPAQLRQRARTPC